MKTDYKLLALDMDGTLLDSCKHVLPRTAAALEELASRGVTVALSTGRCPVELDDYLPQLGGVRYGCLISGALVYDLRERRALASTPIDTELVLQALDAGADEGAMLHLLCADASVARPDDISHMADFHMEVYQPMFGRICLKVDDVAAYAAPHPADVLKVNLYHRDEASRCRTRERLADLPLTLADAETTSLECSAQGVSKALGLEQLCDYLGISMGQVVAVGDAPNDAAALQAAGCAVAMGNADPQIKAMADLVVADNDHDGIVEAIERLF